MNALEIKNLTKQYPGFQLQSLNLTLPGGCIMGLIGENGAGKSTTIRLILDMIRPDGGSITVLGRDNRENLQLTKEEIGVVLDEVGIPASLTAGQVGRVMAGIFRNWDQPVYEQFLKKMELPEKKLFKEYSRGMKMKLGIAIAMSHHPKLLILDEPTSGLDPVIRDEVVQMLTDFTREEDRSILISSHIVSDLEKLCDYIAFLHKGKLMLCEEKDRLLEEFCFVQGTAEELGKLPREAVLGMKENRYGAEAIVRRSAVSGDWMTAPIRIEDLFLYMVKEAR